MPVDTYKTQNRGGRGIKGCLLYTSHDMGDQVLRKFSLILKEIFSENSYIGRFGGDEFLVFIFNQESNIEIENKANKLLEKMKEINDQYIGNLSCSIGICFVENENNFENLFKKSDKA